MGGEKTVQLRDVCVKIGSGATPRGGKEAYKGGATSLIRSQNIYNEGFHRDGLVYIDDSQSAKLSNVEVRPNDVLLNITGDSVARCCQVAADVLPARVNQHVAIIRPQPSTLDARFLRYVLVSHEYQSRLLAFASAGATRPALTKSMIEELDVPSPPLPTQKAIAHILGTLDDKIELNRQMNATLEEMARAIFKSWFIDFDPVIDNALRAGNPIPEEFAERAERRRAMLDQNQPSPDLRPPSPSGRGVGGEGAKLDALLAGNSIPEELSDRAALRRKRLEQNPDPNTTLPNFGNLFPDCFRDSELGPIPVGWEAQSLPEVIEVNPSRTLKRGTIAPYLDMKNLPTQGPSALEVIDREFSSGSKFQNGDTLLARITPCLENGKTGFVDFLDEGQVGWGSTEYIVLAPKTPLPPQYGYLLARSDELRTHAIQNMTGSSGRQRVPTECFCTFWLAVPPPEIANRFDDLTAPMMAQIKANSTQFRTLATPRDTLLPKLLSGELSTNIIPENSNA